MTKNIDNCYKMFNDYQRMIIEAKTQKNDNPDYDPKIQKLVNKLISEETIAHDFYIGCIMAVDKDEVCCIENIFVETANDELNDHCKSLVKWAKDNGYDVPFKYKDYEKEASPSVVKQYRDLKTKQSAKFYIEEAIKSEHDAIASYEEALKNKKFIIIEKKSDFCNAPLLAVFATESQFSEVYPGKEELYKAATFTNIFGKEEKVLRKTFRDQLPNS